MASNDINIKLLIDTANSAKSVKEVRKAMLDLKTAALDAGEGSSAFQELTSAAGEMKDKMDDLNATIKFFSDDIKNLNGLKSIGEGIAGGFAIAQGSMALFGVESKSVEKALLKVQSAMAILQGIQAVGNVIQKSSAASLFITNGLRTIAIRLTSQQAVATAAEAAATGTATIAQRALNAAMNANPIGILITLILAGVAALTFFSNSSEDAAAAQKDMTASIDIANASIQESIDKERELSNLRDEVDFDLKSRIDLLKAQGASQKEIYDAERALLKRKRDGLINDDLESRDLSEASVLKRKNDIQNLYDDIEILDINYTNSVKDARDKQNKIHEEANKKELEALRKLSVEKQTILLDEITERNKVEADIRNKTFQENIDSEVGRAKEILQNQKDLLDKQQAVLETNVKQELAILDEKFKLGLKPYYEKQFALAKGNTEEEKKLNESLAKDIVDLQGGAFTNGIISEEAYSLARMNIKVKGLDDLTGVEQRYIDIIHAKYLKNSIAIKQRYADEAKISAANTAAIKNDKIQTEIETEKELAIIKANLITDEKARNKELLSINRDFLNRELAANETQLNTQTVLITEKYLTEKKNKELTSQQLLELEAKYQLDLAELKKTYGLKNAKLNNDVLDTTAENLKLSATQWIDFYTQLGNSIINLMSTINNQISAGRLSVLEDEKAATLKSFDEQTAAYWDATKQKTNAEQFKFDKDKEFSNKRAALEKEFDDKKKEIEYAAAVRNYEASLATGAVNAAGAILKAGEQGGPVLMGITAALTLLQLGILAANPPQKYAVGGMVTGPGTGTSDSIPTLLSNGESVINAKSTKMFMPMLSMINEAGGGVPLMNTQSMATGGMVQQTTNTIDNSEVANLLREFMNRPIETYVVSSKITEKQRGDTRLKNRTSF